jgi:hypothetical protein
MFNNWFKFRYLKIESKENPRGTIAILSITLAGMLIFSYPLSINSKSVLDGSLNGVIGGFVIGYIIPISSVVSKIGQKNHRFLGNLPTIQKR